MPISKVPFRSYTLDEQKPDTLETGKVFTVRLSGQEYQELLKAMTILNISSDSTCLKTLAKIGQNVAFTLLPNNLWRWLTDGARRVDESKLGKIKAKIGKDVTQEQANL